jgi:DNA-binding transcriptional regulator YiaG
VITPADIISLRARLNWSQEHLAQQLGTSRATISRWETGRLPIPQMARLALSWLTACYEQLEEEDDAKQPRAWPVDSRGRMLDG